MIKKSHFVNLNNFKILETLESGEFGVILRIEEKSTGKIFGAKIPGNIYAEKSNISREIEILQSDHPSISELIGFCPFDFDNNRRPVIVTGFYTNRTLKQVLDLKRSMKNLNAWTNTKMLINIYGIASAMSFLHSQNIIHRDLNPKNILEDDHLYPKITKFSLSQNNDEKRTINSFAQNIFDKSPIYMAPELFVNNSYSTASDVYSFSLIVYEILTNEIPFQNLHTMDILIKVVRQSYRPDIHSKSIPKFFKKLITDCWSQDPQKRPSFDQIIQLLKRKNDFINEFDIDEKEYSNYVNYIDDYIENPKLNEAFNFSEHGIPKVCLFTKKEREPIDIDVKIIDLSKFKQLRRIGEGTFGTVYEVLNLENGKKIAAKVFKRKYYKNFEKEKKINNLKNELTVLKRLNHPAVVKFIGFNPTNFDNLPNPVIFTELAVNRSLENFLQLERNGLASDFWTDTKKLIIIYGIVSSMTYLHSQNIIHRNLKPSSILIDELIHPKLADFSLSKIISINGEEDDDNGNQKLLGTYTYIAPEIYENLEYSKASDVYAFSLIVYEIMTNQKPIFGSTFYQIMMNVTKGFRPEIKKEVPDCFKKLIEDCWSPNPNDRPSFSNILKLLRTNKNFITESVKQAEFYDYANKIDKMQSNFDCKVLQTIDYESIYQRQKVVLITDGFLDLKNYQKKEKISKDNYSTTFKVVEKGTNAIYSAKESSIEINNLCKEEIDNLTKDVSILSSMNHPYILKFIGYSSVNFNNIHKPVIITEYGSNKTLEDFIDMERDGLCIEGWDDTKKLITIFGIAYCMSFLHSHDIIHYNLKPSNIIIDENYHPKICGFGLYKHNLINKCLEIQSIYNPKQNFVYSTPELLSSGKFTKESDVYSFAFIVYELITNERPFSNFSDPIQLLKSIEKDSFRPDFNSSIPDCYKELIESCWSQNPQERPSFDKIVSILKKDSRFITPSINKDEYFEFANFKYVEPEKYDLQQLMNAADNNDPKALFRFGLLYSKGIAMPLNKEKAARFYQKAAALGYAQAQCNLGKMYLRGYGIQQDKQKALELFLQAASKGDAKALFNLGVLYFKGNGVEQDFNKAIEYYEKAVELNDPEAQFNLGLMYNNGDGVSVDKKKAFDLFQRSAKYGNSNAQFNLGVMYQNGVDDFLQKDVKMCIQMYQKAANQDNAQAQFNLALLYLNGETDFPVNKEKAIQLFEKAAQQGNEEAKLHLEFLLSKSGNKKGFQIEKICRSLETKIGSIHNSLFTSFYNEFKTTLTYIDDIFVDHLLSEYISKSIKINKMLKMFNTESSTLISNKSLFPSLKTNTATVDPINNEISEINKLKIEVQSLETRLNQLNKQIHSSESAESSSSSSISTEASKIRSIIKKAENGDAKSQLSLAAFYATGKGGVHQNNEKALKYYLMAAQQGNMNAQYAAASYFYYGRGTKEDKHKAFELFLKAAEQGHSKAQFALGHYYQFDANKAQQNYENAMNWYKKAAEQGHEAAKQAINGNFE